MTSCHRSATVWSILSEVTDLPSVMVLNVRGLVHMWSIWAVLRLASTNGQTAKRPNGQTAKRPNGQTAKVAKLGRCGQATPFGEGSQRGGGEGGSGEAGETAKGGLGLLTEG